MSTLRCSGPVALRRGSWQNESMMEMLIDTLYCSRFVRAVLRLSLAVVARFTVSLVG